MKWQSSKNDIKTFIFFSFIALQFTSQSSTIAPHDKFRLYTFGFNTRIIACLSTYVGMRSITLDQYQCLIPATSFSGCILFRCGHQMAINELLYGLFFFLHNFVLYVNGIANVAMDRCYCLAIADKTKHQFHLIHIRFGGR